MLRWHRRPALAAVLALAIVCGWAARAPAQGPDGLPAALAGLGLERPRIALTEGVLTVSFVQAPVDSGQDLAAAWLPVLTAAAEWAPWVETIELRVAFPAGPPAVVRASLRDIQAYARGLTRADALLGALEIEAGEDAPPPAAEPALPPTLAPASAPYDLYVKRMDVLTLEPRAGEPVRLNIMLVSADYPPGAPPFPASHYRWRQGPGSPWLEGDCPRNDRYAQCAFELGVTYDRPGRYDVEVEADSRGAISETDETNNLKSWTLEVAAVAAAAGPGRIAFASDADGNFDIYTAAPDGSGRTRLTGNPGEDWFPAWSPDGTRIAYGCRTGAAFDLCVMNADGSDGRTILKLQAGASVFRPAWSPDGRSIAFSVESADARTAIYTAPVPTLRHGGDTTFLAYGTDPSWSPDGARLAYVEMGQTALEIAVIGADGSGQRVLTAVGGFSRYPAWSPDGTRIAHVTDPDGVFVMNADGSDRRQISTRGSWGLAWSPDGTQLAISDEASVIVLEGDGREAATVGPGIQPSWSR